MHATERSGGGRRTALGWVLVCASLLFATALVFVRGAGARSVAPPRLVLEVPRELHVGEHAHVELTVELPPEAAEPLLLTPFREGRSLEVVKGRLLRGDARDPGAELLRFALPVLATAPGTALIGVRLLAYLCTPRCRAVEAEARANVVVLAR
jgi:hypothetical protein